MTNSAMEGRRVTFAGLLPLLGDDGVGHVIIPPIQRDYAQGRTDSASTEIRVRFVESLALALEGGTPLELDFVYGGVTADGAFAPIDGQQRLTTLFLLHWYLALRNDGLADDADWKHFTYSTRPSARMFCERLVDASLMVGAEAASRWIQDQPWFLYTWRSDPTIRAMLVMIDAIADRFSGIDVAAAWQRLMDADDPAVTFHALVIEELATGDDLYIKMNSRGKPLTPFEIFKANFEQAIADPERCQDFSFKIDGEWSDMLWQFRSRDNTVDDALMNYLNFVVTVMEWRLGRELTSDRLIDRAKRLFGGAGVESEENLEFLFAALNVWVGVDSVAYFENLFCRPGRHAGLSPDAALPRFGGIRSLDLFADCCGNFRGARNSASLRFGLPDTLLLYGVLIHKVAGSGDETQFKGRLRTLRNLIEASGNEIRLSVMPQLLAEVEALVLSGDLGGLRTFNQGQVEEERIKQPLRDFDTELGAAMRALEDHALLRGSLTAFDLEPEGFTARAGAFAEMMSDSDLRELVTGAMLAQAPYQRQVSAGRFRFLSASDGSETVWRELLTGVRRESLKPLRSALRLVLDEVAGSALSPAESLQALITAYVEAARVASLFDWRYYLVAYPEARTGASGRYVSERDDMSFGLCMLNKSQLNSHYRDPYLSAIVGQARSVPELHEPWFTGRAYHARWLEVPGGQLNLRSVQEGLELTWEDEDLFSELEAWAEHERVALRRTGDETALVELSQVADGANLYDTVDRVQLGARIVSAFAHVG